MLTQLPKIISFHFITIFVQNIQIEEQFKQNIYICNTTDSKSI